MWLWITNSFSCIRAIVTATIALNKNSTLDKKSFLNKLSILSEYVWFPSLLLVGFHLFLQGYWLHKSNLLEIETAFSCPISVPVDYGLDSEASYSKNNLLTFYTTPILTLGFAFNGRTLQLKMLPNILLLTPTIHSCDTPKLHFSTTKLKCFKLSNFSANWLWSWQ